MSPHRSVPSCLQFAGILIKPAGSPSSQWEVALGTHCPQDGSVGPLPPDPGMGDPQQHAEAGRRDSRAGEEPCGTAGGEAQGAPHARGLSLFSTFGGVLRASDTVWDPLQHRHAPTGLCSPGGSETS